MGMHMEQEGGQGAVPVSMGIDRLMDRDIEKGQRQWQVQWLWSVARERSGLGGCSG